ncbi:MAG TPA: hypothetical protein PLR26_07450 [Bacilli bacterium]|nr:hypothetical protein [Bacilli bacterium]
MTDKKFLIASIFILIGAIIATIVFYHFESGLFFEDITSQDSYELEEISKIKFRRVTDEGNRPFVVKIWVKDEFKVYRYEASGLDVAFEDTRASIQRFPIYQQTTSGVLEAMLTFGALYVASAGLAVYHFLLQKKLRNQ